jgi:hypothetical protein
VGTKKIQTIEETCWKGKAVGYESISKAIAIIRPLEVSAIIGLMS